MKKAKKTALCGMVSALSVVLMLISSVAPVLMYILPVLSGFLVWYISVLINKKYALGVYFSTSMLSLILLTDKETALAYAMFFGFYPILKDNFRKFPKIIEWILKFALFNACAVAVGFSGVLIFGVSSEEYSEFGKWTIPILLTLANLMFIMYENMMNMLKFLLLGFVKKTRKYLK